MSELKQCTECGVSKPKHRFGRNKSWCNMCVEQSHRNRRLEKKIPNAISGLLQKWGRHEGLQ